jgi:hypothetical protein
MAVGEGIEPSTFRLGRCSKPLDHLGPHLPSLILLAYFFVILSGRMANKKPGPLKEPGALKNPASLGAG